MGEGKDLGERKKWDEFNETRLVGITAEMLCKTPRVIKSRVEMRIAPGQDLGRLDFVFTREGGKGTKTCKKLRKLTTYLYHSPRFSNSLSSLIST